MTSRFEIKPPVTVFDMEQALILAHDLWHRSPDDGGRSPWAKDGPWSDAQREAGDYAAPSSLTLLDLGGGREIVVRKLDPQRPHCDLSPREIELRDAITGWHRQIETIEGRKLVDVASFQLWRGEGRVSWSRIKSQIKASRTASGLRQAYHAELARMVCRSNGVPLRYARALQTKKCILPFGLRG